MGRKATLRRQEPGRRTLDFRLRGFDEPAKPRHGADLVVGCDRPFAGLLRVDLPKLLSPSRKYSSSRRPRRALRLLVASLFIGDRSRFQRLFRLLTERCFLPPPAKLCQIRAALAPRECLDDFVYRGRFNLTLATANTSEIRPNDMPAAFLVAARRKLRSALRPGAPSQAEPPPNLAILIDACLGCAVQWGRQP